MARNGNDRIITDTKEYVGPGKPATTGPFPKSSDFQAGQPVSDCMVRQVNAGSPNGGVKIQTVGPDWGPDPKPSPEV